MKNLCRTTEALQKELALVNRWITAVRREPRPEEWEASGDNTPLSEVADAMQVAEDREVRAEYLGNLIEQAARLEEALHRVREGTYGICVRCEKAIHHERLEALPEAPHCLECQRQLEAGALPGKPSAKEWLDAGDFYRETSQYD